MQLNQKIYLENSNKSSPKKSQVLYLFRDSQQSALRDSDWLISVFNLKKLVNKVADTGIKAIEAGGGRYFEIIMLKGRNPFYVLQTINEAIKEHPDYDENNPVQMQVLVRGRNGMGFNPIDESVQEALIDEHQKAGVSIFRNFHALNDIKNIYISPTAKHVQGALAYTSDPKDVEDPIYNTQYYINYANLLLEKGVKSICIKDMAGQLAPKELVEIVSGIRKLHIDVPITLHMHSSNEDLARKTISKAIDIGIQGIEFALPPLAGGASHLDMNEFFENEKISQRIQPIDKNKLTDLTNFCGKLFSEFERVDLKISANIRVKMSEFGIPGGALPSVLSLLESQFPEKFSEISEEEFAKFIDQYLAILNKVREHAGRPPLVTPSADIICRQSVFCLSATRNHDDTENIPLNAFYTTITPDFCRLILGHFGFVYRYGSKPDINKEYHISRPIADLIDLCAAREFEGNTFTNFWIAGKNGAPLNPAEKNDLPKFNYYLEKVDDFMLSFANRLETQGFSKSNSVFIAKSLINRFATKNQLALMLAMKPKGKDDDFIWKKALFADFSNDSVGTKVPFDDDEIKQIVENLAKANCEPDSWKSRSIDLLVFFSMTNKFLNKEKMRYEKLSNLILKKKQILDTIRLEQKMVSDSDSWLSQADETQSTSNLHKFNTTNTKIRLLKEQLEQTERNINVYQESKDIINLKDNVLGLEFLNTYVYSCVRHILEKIKLL